MNKLKLIIILCSITLVFALSACGKSSGSGSESGDPCEQVAAAFAKAIQDQSGEEYMNLHPDDLIQDRINGWNYTKEEVIEEFGEKAKDSYDYISEGEENVKIKYMVSNKKHLDKDELAKLNYDMQDCFEFRKDCITDAYKVKFRFYAKGKKNVINTSTDYVVKVDGKWYRQYNPNDEG